MFSFSSRTSSSLVSTSRRSLLTSARHNARPGLARVQLPTPVRGAQRRAYSTPLPEARSSMGAFTPTSAVLFIVAGAGLAYYFKQEKARLEEEKEKERSLKSYGRPHIGGPFTLMSHEGKEVTQDALLGKWSLVYFGFTNCPDICPAELDKVTAIMNDMQKQHGDIFLPIFISVDPARDSPKQIADYLVDFHPSFLGLVGDYTQTKSVCKKWRVYFSTPPNADPKGDYLVDHSIFVYFMDPEGKFVDAFGQVTTVLDCTERINKEIGEWQKEHGGKKL